MLVSGVLFVLILILAGCWLYSLIDAALTPAATFRGWGMPKAVWIGIIAVTFIAGAVAWLAFRATTSRFMPGRFAPRRFTLGRFTPGRFASRRFTPGHRTAPNPTYVYWYPDPAAADASFARHPAGRSRKTPADGWPLPKGPDDDPDFLRELDRRIKGTPDDEPD